MKLTTTTCLCGNIEFGVTGPFGEVRYCHCTQCRKVTGSAFSANVKIHRSNWSLSKGSSDITEFEQAPGIFRAFCSQCGSPIYSRLDNDPDYLRVRLGSFDEPPGVNVTAHVWVSSKAPWHAIDESIPCFDERAED